MLKLPLLKQKLMRRVLWGLIPIIGLATYFFGLRVLVLLAIVSGAGYITEYLIMRNIQGPSVKVSEAVFVSCWLFVLTLPPTTPIWVAVVGIVFGILFGKGVFGGFGKNISNPAILGRCFIYISFPNYMTINWAHPFSGFPGGLAQYTTGTEALTTATPIIAFNKFELESDYLHLLLGNIAGSIGEASALLIAVIAVYMIITRTASWKIMAATAGSFFALSTLLYLFGVVSQDPIFALLSGGFLFGTVFMATDPITAPTNESAKVIYGVLIGVLTVIIRAFSIFTEGIMFAILLANTFVPLIEMKLKGYLAKQVSA